MKKNFALLGITILLAAQNVFAVDVRNFAGNGLETLSDTLSLRESTVRAHFVNQNRSALRLATVSETQLRERGASRTYPEMLRGLPSLYATSESGSYGDAKLNIRGFGQENISVLLNGIPISGLVSGGMYWNNWMGLADATWAVQVQKGVGASMLSDGSVGGSVNIITESPSDEFSVEIGSYAAVYGNDIPSQDRYGSAKSRPSIGAGPFPSNPHPSALTHICSILQNPSGHSTA